MTIVGYSFWGFLYKENIPTNTPDGAGITRPVLRDELIKRGHTIQCLLPPKEGHNLLPDKVSYSDDLETPDVFLFEYRWKIPSRNWNEDGTWPEHPDYILQSQMLARLALTKKPVIIYDKDLKMTQEEYNDFTKRGFIVVEPSLYPRYGNQTLLFPFDTNTISRAKTDVTKKDTPVVYIGNRYERDQQFDDYLPELSKTHIVSVYGSWGRADHLRTCSQKWPFINFNPQLNFNDMGPVYSTAWTTVLLAPDRYLEHGHITQRIFECVTNGCIPLGMAEQMGIDRVVLRENIVTPNTIQSRLEDIMKMTNDQYNDMLQRQANMLRMFDVRGHVNLLERLWRLQ